MEYNKVILIFNMILIQQIVVNKILSDFYKHYELLEDADITNLKAADMFFDYIKDKVIVEESIKKKLWIKAKRMIKYYLSGLAKHPIEYQKKRLEALYKSYLLKEFLISELKESRFYMFDKELIDIKVK